MPKKRVTTFRFPASQSWLDDGLPGYGVSGREPGLVDMGGRGCVCQGQERSENGT